MTLLYTDGFDLQDMALRNWTGSNTTSATTPWGVGSSVQIAGTTNKRNLAAAVTKVFVGGHARFTTIASLNNMILLYGDAGATNHLILATDASGRLQVTRGGTVIATGTTQLLANSWYYIEMSATISDTTGTVEIRVNGSTEATFGPGDTKNAGTNSTIDAVAIGCSAGTANWDDFYIGNDQGSANNNFLGMIRVQTLVPSGAGSSTQFTPTAAPNYSTVNDIPDVTTTYNSDTVSGHRDTFAMGDLTAATSSVLAVQQVMHGKQLDAGVATIKQAQKSGATVSYGTTKTLTASTVAYFDVFETNPAGGGWTPTNVNAIEAGYEIV